MDQVFRTRFAPSPTGYLHIGHAYSALTAYEAAIKADGQMLLRIEDIDTGRSRPEFEAAITEDLDWLGIAWSGNIRRQSEHFDDYKHTLDKLDELGLLYPCFCTRKEIALEVENSANAPHGPEGYLYPGICKSLNRSEIASLNECGKPFALRFNLERAVKFIKAKDEWPLRWFDMEEREFTAEPELLGDVVLARKDTPTSYHLAVVHDDHAQAITHVIRGQDLVHSTHIHRLLQAILGYDPPHYHHHKLITDKVGEKLAKSHNARTIRSYREKGARPGELRKMLGFI